MRARCGTGKESTWEKAGDAVRVAGARIGHLSCFADKIKRKIIKGITKIYP